MKKSLFLTLLVFMSMLTVSCKNPVCDIAKTGTDIIAQRLANRWECDKTKLYDYMIQPTAKHICKETSGEQGSLDFMCPMVTGFIVDLGEAEIVKRFDCNSEKVREELKVVDKLCDNLKK